MVNAVQLIRDEEIECDVKKWVCMGCNAAFMSPAQASDAVKRAISIFQMKHGLLTADQIRAGRKSKGLTVSELADASDLGVATIKRLEAGTTVQRASTNKLLLTVFSQEDEELPDYQILIHSKNIAVACSITLSKWNSEVPWNTPDPWNSQLLIDGTTFCADDSNEFALAG